ncbi:MAG TPA: TetR/AcrR family transcriptional regulator [Solirubrobacteraceae bacterium]|nr:TetR/AcrR family transcriptional regulator [Solirubrobacteraceae bacterium]
MITSSTTTTIGRPRDARTDRAILAASLELIAEVGIHDFRMDDVAERARVGKSAIYRRYRSKDELVGATVAALVSEIDVADTGDTREDIVALMNGAVDVYTDPIRAAVMPSLVGAMQRRPELARTIREGFLTGRRDALREVLTRGIARGDLAADLDMELALDVLGGPLFYRLLITGGPINRELAEGVADLVMRGFADTTKEKAA